MQKRDQAPRAVADRYTRPMIAFGPWSTTLAAGMVFGLLVALLLACSRHNRVANRLLAGVLVVFALGYVPMWAVHRSVIWRQNRRIRTLENSLKNTAYDRERDGPAIAAAAGESPVVKSGKDSAEAADNISPADGGSDGSSGE